MAKVIVMPKLGLTMTEGLIGSWYKKEDDSVEVSEKLFGVETDKLTNDIESTEAGILRKILVGEGSTVPCLEPVAIIGAADEDISSLIPGSAAPPSSFVPQDSAAAKSKVISAPAAEKPAGGRIIAAPAAKKLAAERGIDLSQVKGSGPGGRITIKDVENYFAAEKIESPKASPMAAKLAAEKGIDLADISSDGRIMKKDVLSYLSNHEAAALEERLPMSSMRKIISKRMTKSWSYPSVTFDISVDVTALLNLKNSLKEIIKISYTDMIIKCVSAALIEYPQLNCSIDEDAIIIKKYINIGVAVAIDNGLLVPVLRDADKKGLAVIAKEAKQLADDARTGRLSPDALSGGTFTITNLGMFGIESFSPIINLPEAAILGVNTIKEELALVNGEVIAKPVMKLSLTADHRAVDGAVAAAFLKRLKELMENPSLLLL